MESASVETRRWWRTKALLQRARSPLLSVPDHFRRVSGEGKSDLPVSLLQFLILFALTSSIYGPTVYRQAKKRLENQNWKRYFEDTNIAMLMLV